LAIFFRPLESRGIFFDFLMVSMNCFLNETKILVSSKTIPWERWMDWFRTMRGLGRVAVGVKSKDVAVTVDGGVVVVGGGGVTVVVGGRDAIGEDTVERACLAS
jgi:hypothetical protein